MIVAKSSSSSRYVYDNYAIDYERYERYEKPEKKATKAPVKKKPNLKHRVKMVVLVITMFCTGVLIVGRYAMIMNLNNQCKEIKNNITKNLKENERLNIELLKYYDIKQVEKDATTELNMIRPSHANIVYLTVESKKEADIIEEDVEPLKVGLIDRIVDFFN